METDRLKLQEIMDSIRQAMKERNITQAKLAKYLDTTQSMISNQLNCVYVIQLIHLLDICDVLGIYFCMNGEKQISTSDIMNTIKAEMKKANVKQMDLSIGIGRNVSTVGQWIRGSKYPTLINLFTVCRYLGIDVSIG